MRKILASLLIFITSLLGAIMTENQINSEEKVLDEYSKKIITYIKNEDTKSLIKIFGKQVCVTRIASLGRFKEGTHYGGFLKKSGILYATIFDTKKFRTISGEKNLYSFKEAFNNSNLIYSCLNCDLPQITANFKNNDYVIFLECNKGVDCKIICFDIKPAF